MESGAGRCGATWSQKALSTHADRTMAALNRTDLENLQRREIHLSILSAVFVFILAGGVAVLMYPLVFVHPVEASKWTLRIAFVGFCVLSLLFVFYLLDRQRMVRRLKQQLLEELERNLELRHQANVDLLKTMPDVNHFWDRLTMEFRRALTMERTLSLVLINSKSSGNSPNQDEATEAWGDAAKAISRKLRPTDSVYRLAADLLALVLPETETKDANRIAVRLAEELRDVGTKRGLAFEIKVYNYPQHVRSAHELEDIVKSLLPEKEEWAIPSATG